ncbi:MAG: DUF427 domain-containing protein [Actinobacteria bacterium]|nr:DUF427 domain-containing protein [Actinomycetota bacterium]
MSLTANHGPFSEQPRGRLNFELDSPSLLLYLDPMPYRVRVLFEGETIVDAFEPLLLHEGGRLPVYHFKPDEVHRDFLEPSESKSESKGIVEYWTVRVGDRVAPDAARAYSQPVEGAALLEGLFTFDWNAMDEWFCEDEQLFGHARDPFSRIDTYKTSRHLRISLEGELLAETRRAIVLYETGLPPRYYIPAEDVRADLLIPSGSRSRCAYKGSASYWSVQIGERVVEDLVWAYLDPERDAEPVRDLLCFFNERVDLEIEGEPAERPVTQWTRDQESNGDGTQALRGLMRDRVAS